MKESFRQSMAWLHTWAGLILGWLLFAMFLTGTASYFRPEITHWMQPERPAFTVTPGVAAENAVKSLQTMAPNAARWFISMPAARNETLRVNWSKPGGGFETRTLDPATGAPVTARDSLGGEFFYRFHFELHMPPLTGRWVAGIAAMVMFVTIISGIITHRRIFADFFTFRPRKAQRSWLDGHNVLAVLALPYHLIITYTGIITLMLMYLPWGIAPVYPEGRPAFIAEAFSIAPPPQPAGQPGMLAPLGPMMAQAEARWPDTPVGLITISQPGDANAAIELSYMTNDRVAHGRHAMQFEGTTGRLVSTLENDKPISTLRQSLYGLHLGRFGGVDLRLLFFLCGLMGTAMVGSGLVLWTVKRRDRAETKAARFGVALVERLNVAVIAGLPIAMAAFLLSNRLLPLGLDKRSDAEVMAFFGIWLLAAVYALWRKPAESWPVLLLAATAIWAITPVANWLTVGLHAPGFDAALLAVAVSLLLIWRKVTRRPAPALRPGVAE